MGIDWLRIGDVFRGIRPWNDFPDSVDIAVSGKGEDPLDWHYYDGSGLGGILSQALVDLIGESNFLCHRLVPCSINEAPYYFFPTTTRISCLNAAESEFKFFKSNPERIMRVLHFSFDMSRVPADGLFSIPESLGNVFLAASSPTATRLRESGLKGFELRDLP